MVGPARKREAVAHLGSVLEVSARRACQVISQPRSTQRYCPLQPDKDALQRLRLCVLIFGDLVELEQFSGKAVNVR